MTRIKVRRVLPVLLCLALATAMTPLPRPARADAEIERFHEDKFWTYVGCAASIALASGSGAWVLVVIACGKAATAYWTE